MTDGRSRVAFPYRLVLAVLLGAMLLYLVGTFVAQIGVNIELRDRLGRIEDEIVATEKANADLEARLEYVSSNDAAEEWARLNGWAGTDEVLVVVLAPDAEDAPPGEEPLQEAPAPVSNRESWWNLFFGER